MHQLLWKYHLRKQYLIKYWHQGCCLSYALTNKSMQLLKSTVKWLVLTFQSVLQNKSGLNDLFIYFLNKYDVVFYTYIYKRFLTNCGGCILQTSLIRTDIGLGSSGQLPTSGKAGSPYFPFSASGSRRRPIQDTPTLGNW